MDSLKNRAIENGKIQKLLTDSTYMTPVESTSKFKVTNSIATYLGYKLVIVDVSAKTLSPFELGESSPAHAKRLKTLILGQAAVHGYKVLPVMKSLHFRDLSDLVKCVVVHDYWLGNKEARIEDIFETLNNDTFRVYDENGEENV